MRQSCPKCVCKHIAQAIVLMHEYYNNQINYAHHKWLAIGHLAEAETESCIERPDLSIRIRDARLLIQETGPIELITLLKEAVSWQNENS